MPRLHCKQEVKRMPRYTIRNIPVTVDRKIRDRAMEVLEAL